MFEQLNGILKIISLAGFAVIASILSIVVFASPSNELVVVLGSTIPMYFIVSIMSEYARLHKSSYQSSINLLVILSICAISMAMLYGVFPLLFSELEYSNTLSNVYNFLSKLNQWLLLSLIIIAMIKAVKAS